MKYLQKYASIILLFLLIALIVALFFNQNFIGLLSTILIIFAVGTAAVFTIYDNWETKQNDSLTNAQFARNTFIDLLGLALTMSVAMWLGASAALSVNSAGAGQVWGLLAGIVVSFGAALVVGKVWGRVSYRFRAGAILQP